MSRSLINRVSGGGFGEKLKNFGLPALSITAALLALYAVSYVVISGIVDGTAQVKYKKEDLIDDALETLAHVRDKNARYGQLPVTMYSIEDGSSGTNTQSQGALNTVLLTVPSDLEGSAYVDMAISCHSGSGPKVGFTDTGIGWGVADYQKAEVTLSQRPDIANHHLQFTNVTVKRIDIGGNVLHAFNSDVIKDSPCRVSFADRAADIEKFFVLTNSDRALLTVAFCAVGFACFVLGGVFSADRRDEARLGMYDNNDASSGPAGPDSGHGEGRPPA